MRAAAAAFKQGLRMSYGSTPSSSNEETKAIAPRELILPPGKQLTDKVLKKLYDIEGLLGSSATSNVHKAVELESREPCALKIVKRTSFQGHPEVSSSFMHTL